MEVDNIALLIKSKQNWLGHAHRTPQVKPADPNYTATHERVSAFPGRIADFMSD